MPCSDNGQSEYYRQQSINDKLKNTISFKKEINKIDYNIRENVRELSEYAEAIDQKIPDLLKRNDMLARLICYLMNGLSVNSRNYVLANNYELAEWWKEHEKFDVERNNKEKE